MSHETNSDPRISPVIVLSLCHVKQTTTSKDEERGEVDFRPTHGPTAPPPYSIHEPTGTLFRKNSHAVIVVHPPLLVCHDFQMSCTQQF